jgi:hypothetical protein
MSIKGPKLPDLLPKEKALKFLSTKSKEDVIKEVTQLVYLSEDEAIAKNYWERVLDHVQDHVVEKYSGMIG